MRLHHRANVSPPCAFAIRRFFHKHYLDVYFVFDVHFEVDVQFLFDVHWVFDDDVVFDVHSVFDVYSIFYLALPLLSIQAPTKTFIIINNCAIDGFDLFLFRKRVEAVAGSSCLPLQPVKMRFIDISSPQQLIYNSLDFFL